MAKDKMHLANLGFYLSYDTGRTKDEIESELLKLLLQDKTETHYDRDVGGSFSNLSQEPNDLYTQAFVFYYNIVEAIYRRNEERNFENYIIVGAEDIILTPNVDTGGLDVYIQWKLLQDLSAKGSLEFVRS